MQTKKQEKKLIKQIDKLADQCRGNLVAQARAHDVIRNERDNSKCDTLLFKLRKVENQEIVYLVELDEKLNQFFESDPHDQVQIAKLNYMRSRVGASLGAYDRARIIEALNQKRQEIADQAKQKKKSSYYYQEFMWTKKLNAELSYYFLDNKGKEGMTPRQAAHYTEFTDLLQTVCERHCELRDNYAMPVNRFDQMRKKITSALDSVKKRMGR